MPFSRFADQALEQKQTYKKNIKLMQTIKIKENLHKIHRNSLQKRTEYARATQKKEHSKECAFYSCQTAYRKFTQNDRTSGVEFAFDLQCDSKHTLLSNMCSALLILFI